MKHEQLTSTQARSFAKRIIAGTVFTNVKSNRGFNGWEINIDGGSAANYGRTINTIDAAEDTLRIFAH